MKRSRSTSKLPIISRGSSISRVSSLSTQQKTPVRRQRSKSASNTRTPQSAILNSNADKTKQKDVRPINDKKWQAEVLSNTQKYFQNIPDAKAILNKGISIKPITLNIFVSLANIVLQNIDKKFLNLTLANYTDLLPKYLKLLRYPGQVSVSMLKTANTIHSWPHILAILSWLVELDQIKLNNDWEQILFSCPPDAPLEQQIQRFEAVTIIESFKAWNQHGTELQPEMLENKYKEFYNYSEEAEIERKSKLEKLKEELRLQEVLLRQDNEDLKEDEEEVAMLRKKRDDQMQRCNLLRKDKKNTVKFLQNDRQSLETLRKALANKKMSVEKLREQVNRQPVSVDEYEQLLQKVPALERQRKFLRDKRDAEQMLYVEKLTEREQLETINMNSVLEFNTNLLRPASKYPELKEFEVDQNKIFIKESKEYVISYNERWKQFSDELEVQSKTIDEKKATIEKIINQLKKEIDSLKEQVSNEQMKMVQLQKSIEDLRTSKTMAIEQEKEELEKIDKEIELMNKKCQIALNEQKYKEKELQAIIEKKNKLQEQSAEIRKKEEAFFQKLHDHIINVECERYEKIRQTAVKISKDKLKNLEKAEKAMKELLKEHLKK